MAGVQVCKANLYNYKMADIFGKVRDTLIQIAMDHDRFLFPSGKINASALAEGLGVNSSTVSRILRNKRITVQDRKRKRGVTQEYQPGPAMMDGIGRLTGCLDHSEVWDLILNSKPRNARNLKRFQ